MKIVVLTNGGYFASLILRDTLRNPAHQVAGVVVVEGDYYGHTGLRSLWAVGRQTFWMYVAYKVFVHFFFRILSRLQSKRALDVAGLAAGQDDIPIIRTNAVNGDGVMAFVESLRPDVLLSVSCPQRIAARLLETASKAAINIHSSLLPEYAGLAPYYWVLAEGADRTGTTVHFMAEKFDEGNVVVQKEVGIPGRCSAFRLFALLSQAGSAAIVEALALIDSGSAGQRQDFSKRSYWSHPTMRSYIMLRKRGYCLIRVGDIVAAAKGRPPFS